MMTRMLTLAATVGLLLPTSASAQRVGDTCVAEHNVRLSSKPGGKGKKVTVRKGAQLIVSGISKGWMQVETSRVQGWTRKMPIAKVCEAKAVARKGKKKKGKKAEPADESPAEAAAETETELTPEEPELAPPPPPDEPELAAVPDDTGEPALITPSDELDPDAPPLEPPPTDEGTEVASIDTGTLAINTDAVGAQVWVDDKLLGFSPVPEQALPPGAHKVKVQRSNSAPWSKTVEVVAGQRTEVAVTLKLKPSIKKSGGLQMSLAWTHLTVGGAGVVGAVALYIVGASKASGLKDDIATYNAGAVRSATTATELEDRRKTVGTLDTFSVIAGAIGVVGLATGAVLLLVPDLMKSEAKPESDNDNPWAQYGSTWQWQLNVGPTGVGVSGSF